jgi:hypothetical protein
MQPVSESLGNVRYGPQWLHPLRVLPVDAVGLIAPALYRNTVPLFRGLTLPRLSPKQEFITCPLN